MISWGDSFPIVVDNSGEFSMAKNTLNIQLNRNSDEPIYQQLIRIIRLQIESGILPAGGRLPASRDLAKQLGVSRISVVNAYAELRSQKYLAAQAGRGTFVNKHIGTYHQSDQMTGHSDDLHLAMLDIMNRAHESELIDFANGVPPTQHFPIEQLHDALSTVLRRDGARALLYEDAEGNATLRQTVCNYVSALGIRCTPKNVLITGGAQQAIDLVIQALLTEGSTIVTANPTYLGVLNIARTRHLHVHGIPVDEDGIRVDLLESYLHDHHPNLIYVMPDFQNPTGSTMPLHRRRQLVALAHRHRIPIVEDAVFHEFRFEDEPLPTLKALDEHGMVIHVSAFTKMLFPGMRIGYLISGDALYNRLVRVKVAGDISTSGLNQRTIQLMLERGVLAPHLERTNHELRKRREVALQAAIQYLPQGSSWTIPHGGMYLWIRLPKHGPTATKLQLRAIEQQVTFTIGSLFYTDQPDPYTLRINFGVQEPNRIIEGFRRICRAWRATSNDAILQQNTGG